MKTKILGLALVLSLVANVALWLQREPKLPRAGAAETSGTADRNAAAIARRRAEIATGAASAAEAAKPGVTWRRPKDAAGWRAFADELRAAGFPEGDVRMIVESGIYLATRSASGIAKMPFWHRFNDGRASRTENEKLQNELRATTEAVFGKREWDPSTADPVYLAGRFGDLPPDKIRSLVKIEQDYGEIYWQQRRAKAGEDALESFEGRTRIRLLEEEKERDIAAVLTSAEFEDFERRQSRAAATVMQGVRDIDISEEEYNALYALQRRALAAVPREEGPGEALAYARNSAAAAEDVRAVLRDDRFFSYMENSDPLYGAAAKFAKANAGLSASQTYELYRLQLDAMTAVAATATSGRNSDLADTPEGRAALAPFAAKLEALLGPQLAATYRQTRTGRIFAPQTKP